MADVLGLSDVSSPDTGKGSQLKTGGRRSHNMLQTKREKEKSAKRLEKKRQDKCAKWKELGFASRSGWLHDTPRKKSNIKPWTL